MKNIIRTLDLYGFDGDCTMYKEDSANKIFAISKVREQKNKKYIREQDEYEYKD